MHEHSAAYTRSGLSATGLNNNKKHQYYQLTCRNQVIIFRLRTGHNRRRYIYSKFKIGETDQCPCGENVSRRWAYSPSIQTAQQYPTEDLAKPFDLQDLRCTIALIIEARLPIWPTQKNIEWYLNLKKKNFFNNL